MNVLSPISLLPSMESTIALMPVRTATVLFIAVFLLLGAFFIGILLITIGRRRASQAGGKAGQAPEIDPWSEAGKRAEPLVDRPDPDPEDDDRRES